MSDPKKPDPDDDRFAWREGDVQVIQPADPGPLIMGDDDEPIPEGDGSKEK